MAAHRDARFPISRFDVPALGDLPDDLRGRIDEIAEKSGFVPNVFMVLARGRMSCARSSPITTR